MNKKNILYLVYHFSKADPTADQALYQIVFLYTHDGIIELRDYPEIFPDKKPLFTSKEELMDFGKKALTSKHFHAVYILSTADFNIGIETCQDLSSFKEIFKRYGQLLEGSSSDDDSNLFSKFF